MSARVISQVKHVPYRRAKGATAEVVLGASNTLDKHVVLDTQCHWIGCIFLMILGGHEVHEVL